jgi:hypothetical protein
MYVLRVRARFRSSERVDVCAYMYERTAIYLPRMRTGRDEQRGISCVCVLEMALVCVIGAHSWRLAWRFSGQFPTQTPQNAQIILRKLSDMD